VYVYVEVRSDQQADLHSQHTLSPLQISANSYINTIPRVTFLLLAPTAFTCLSLFLPTLEGTSGLRILDHVGGGNSCRHTLAYEVLWSTQAKVERSVLKAEQHWGSNSSVENNPLGESVCTPLYVGLPSGWGSVDGDHMSPFPLPISWESSLIGDSERYE